jgi:hypothetical protein
MSDLDPSQPSRFEVVMPNPSDEQRIALMGLAQAYGWIIDESNNLSAHETLDQKNEVITDEDILAASLEIFGNTEDGQNAINILEQLREYFGHMEVIKDWQGYQINKLGHVRANSAFKKLGGHNQSPQAIRAKAERRINQQQLPFPVVCYIPKIPRTKSTALSFEIGEIDKLHLVNYLAGLDHKNQSLSGTVGRAIDVLRAAAGEPSALKKQDLRDDEMEFINVNNLGAMAKDYRLTDNVVNVIIGKIQLALAQQIVPILHPSPTLPSIVFEGGLVIVGGSLQPQKIAIDSLPAIAAMYKQKTHTKMFLEEAPRIIRGTPLPDSPSFLES